LSGSKCCSKQQETRHQEEYIGLLRPSQAACFAGTTLLERVAAHLSKSASGKSCENSISLSALAFLNTADVIIHLNKALLHRKQQPESRFALCTCSQRCLALRKGSGCLRSLFCSCKHDHATAQKMLEASKTGSTICTQQSLQPVQSQCARACKWD